jgi:diaminohydroxyphosphoribosylaminopyrimidine deaminase/5-amino-6-(5-phosphoribosylamino)uracil reductase
MSKPHSTTDQRWMRRAIALAKRGRGSVEPNPMVGCVLVRGGKKIGEGNHEYFGGPHAEPNALKSVRGPDGARGATAYVNLEPCCHTNKKTPPCVPALIKAGVKRVVIGCLDPNKNVSGKGVKQLRAAGIEVVTGVLEAEAKQLNAAYFAGVLHHRPYVTLKWAQSAEGKVAGPSGERRTISNKTSLRVMHGLRARSDAILVSRRTAELDDPMLTARGVKTARKLLRVVLDSELRTPTHLQLVQTAREVPVLIYCTPDAYRSRGVVVRLYESRGMVVIPIAGEREHVSLAKMLNDLFRRGVTHVMVEPGPRLAKTFLRSGLVDRVWVFHSPTRIERKSAPSAAIVKYPSVAKKKLGGDRLVEYLNPASEVYFAAAASADMT